MDSQLPDEVRLFIVESLAGYETPSITSRTVLDRFGIRSTGKLSSRTIQPKGPADAWASVGKYTSTRRARNSTKTWIICRWRPRRAASKRSGACSSWLPISAGRAMRHRCAALGIALPQACPRPIDGVEPDEQPRTQALDGTSLSGFRNTTASGGTVSRIECCWPCQGVGSEYRPPAFPRLPPPKQAASLFKSSR